MLCSLSHGFVEGQVDCKPLIHESCIIDFTERERHLTHIATMSKPHMRHLALHSSIWMCFGIADAIVLLLRDWIFVLAGPFFPVHTINRGNV